MFANFIKWIAYCYAKNAIGVNVTLYHALSTSFKSVVQLKTGRNAMADGRKVREYLLLLLHRFF